MGWREGLANLFDFVGNYAGTSALLGQKAKISEQQKQDALMRDLLEYNIWTNPDDPARRLWQAKHPGVMLPTMSKIRPEQFLRLKAPGLGGGGGLNLFGGGGGVVNVDE